MKLYLSGFMASGKSTVGRRVAERLGWPFVDLDREIESAAGTGIPEIFADQGEQAFRQLESEALGRIAAGPGQQVVALGGGALVDPENLERARVSGWVVYLECSPEVLRQRLSESELRNRPMLSRRRFVALLGERSPGYRDGAHLIVDGDGLPEQVAGAIVDWVRFKGA